MAKKPTNIQPQFEIVMKTVDFRAMHWIETACRGNWWPFSGPWRNLPLLCPPRSLRAPEWNARRPEHLFATEYTVVNKSNAGAWPPGFNKRG